MSFFGRFALAAACAVTLLLVTDVVFVSGLPADARTAYGFVVRIVLYVTAAGAAGTAAASFGWWREHVGRAWTLFSLEFLFLLVNYILRRAAPGAQVALQAMLVGHVISTGRRVLLTVAALGVAIVICHVSLLAQWQAVRAGDVRPGSLISVLADVITFTLVAPLALSALALRGGQLSWIFGFLTISVFGWMVNTGAPSIAALFGDGADTLRTVRLCGIAIAALFNAAAAATQTLATIRVMKGAPADA